MTYKKEPVPERKKKSLLEKYEIPVNHLDYSYIRECKDVVEVERIVKILRSNEEGCYPELLQCAEERLGILSPGNKLLRKVEPILTKNQLDPKEWKSLQEDLLNWKEEVENVESRLTHAEHTLPSPGMFPEVRRPVDKMNTSNGEKGDRKGNFKRISSTDYKKWDMYDADSECLKLDLEEEKRKEEQQRKELEEQKKKMKTEGELPFEEKEIQLIAATAESLSEEERKILAAKEKDLGNEFYKMIKLDQALRHYTRSIYLYPTAVAYNNRAATYLKQCKFTKALDDVNIVLKMEPDNVKAHFRRGLCYQHKNEFEKALDDMLVVLRHDPHHVVARHVADQLREDCSPRPRRTRVKFVDPSNPRGFSIKEVTEEELKRDFKDIDYIEVTEVGLPKIMCNCDGKNTNDSVLKSNDPICFQHLRQQRSEKNEKTTETERGGLPNKIVKPMSPRVPDEEATSRATVGKRNKPLIEVTNPSQGTDVLFSGAKRLEIIELEKIEEKEHSPNKQPLVSKTYAMEKNESPSTLSYSESCIVSDMRGTKPKKVHFGGYIEEQEEEPNVAVIKPFNTAENVDTSLIHSLTDEIMNLSMNQKEIEKPDDFDFNVVNSIPTLGDSISTYVPGVIAQDLSCDIGPSTRDSVNLQCTAALKTLKTSPQSPLSNSSINDEFSSDIDSDDDEFPNEHEFLDDENSSDQIFDIYKVDNLIDNDIDAISKDLFPHDNLFKCECGEGYKLRPSQFESKWLALENSTNPLEERGKLIRLVCPHQLSAVIGNTLDEPLLAGFIACLNSYFDAETEKEKILNYLQSISGLQRFRIIASFLSAKDKAIVDELLKKLQPDSNSIKKAFN